MFNQVRQTKFTTKLFTATILLVVAAVVVSSLNSIRLSKHGLITLGSNAINEIHGSLYNSLVTITDEHWVKLKDDFKLLERQLSLLGEIRLDDFDSIPVTITHQITGKTTQANIPTLKAGETSLYLNETFVDKVVAYTHSSITVFQLVDDKLLRITTTIKNKQEERAVGTYIPSDSPVFKTILKGETYMGRAFVVDKWLLTAYHPIFDPSGKVVGASFSGAPMISNTVKSLITSSRLGKGYFFVYQDDGTVLVHPTLTEKDNLLEMIPELNQEDGWVEYRSNNEEQIAVKKRIEAWGVTLCFALSKKDIVSGIDKDIETSNIIVGVLILIVAVIVAFFLVRTINAPLKNLAAKAIKVGEGDYTQEFQSNSDDAIGQLTTSMGEMVSKSQKMIQDLVKSSQSLSSAAIQLKDLSGNMVTNADETNVLSSEAETNSRAASENMSTITAAMDDSTMNLDMIASSTEEMSNSINEIAKNGSDARMATEKAVESTAKTQKNVVELGEAATSIGTITETITGISQQTNLLALNATIEAASAGEAGKGFAVVANEIKELANQTAKATEQIKSAIDSIQEQTKNTVIDIDSVNQDIKNVDEIVVSIVSAVEEQSITTNEIVKNVGSASQGVININQNVSDSNQLIADASDRVTSVKEKAMSVKSSSTEVESAAESLSQMASEMSELVSRFKI